MYLFRFIPSLLAVFLLLFACTQPDPPSISLFRAVTVEDIDQVERNLYWKTPLNAPGPDGQTPLHIASQQGSLVIVEMLVKYGADLEVQDLQGYTPLETAVLARETRVADYLLKNKALLKPNGLMIESVRQGQADRDVIRFLLSNGADINQADTNGDTPLHVAIKNNHRVIVKYLVKSGADINQPDASGNMPLDIATQLGATDIQSFLIQQGAQSSVK